MFSQKHLWKQLNGTWVCRGKVHAALWARVRLLSGVCGVVPPQICSSVETWRKYVCSKTSILRLFYWALVSLCNVIYCNGNSAPVFSDIAGYEKRGLRWKLLKPNSYIYYIELCTLHGVRFKFQSQLPSTRSGLESESDNISHQDFKPIPDTSMTTVNTVSHPTMSNHHNHTHEQPSHPPINNHHSHTWATITPTHEQPSLPPMSNHHTHTHEQPLHPPMNNHHNHPWTTITPTPIINHHTYT